MSGGQDTPACCPATALPRARLRQGGLNRGRGWKGHSDNQPTVGAQEPGEPPCVSFSPCRSERAGVLCPVVVTAGSRIGKGQSLLGVLRLPLEGGAPALSMTSLKPSPPTREHRLVPAKPLIPEDKESQRLARPSAIRCPRRKSSLARSHWLASLDDPGSSRTGSPWPCLDFPKTNICLASPVQSRSVLSSGGGGGGRGEPLHSSRCPWRGRRVGWPLGEGCTSILSCGAPPMSSEYLPGPLSTSGEAREVPPLASKLTAPVRRFADPLLTLSSWCRSERVSQRAVGETMILWLSEECLLCAGAV